MQNSDRKNNKNTHTHKCSNYINLSKISLVGTYLGVSMTLLSEETFLPEDNPHSLPGDHKPFTCRHQETCQTAEMVLT